MSQAADSQRQAASSIRPTCTWMAWHRPTRDLRVFASMSDSSLSCFCATASKASGGGGPSQSMVQQFTREGLARRRSLQMATCHTPCCIKSAGASCRNRSHNSLPKLPVPCPQQALNSQADRLSQAARHRRAACAAWVGIGPLQACSYLQASPMGLMQSTMCRLRLQADTK